MLLDAIPETLFGMDKIEMLEKSIQIHFSEKRQVLSSSQINGGYSEDLTDVFNFDETPKNSRYCKMLAPTYEEHLKIVAERIGLNPCTCAGLSTAAHMKYAAASTASFNGTRVTAIVTGGINVNAGRAGDPAAWDERAYNQSVMPVGTVNIILAVNSHLSMAALTKAVITSTEAKTAAIQELMAQSLYSDGLATGTGTDGIIVIANPQSDIYLTDSGQHSKLGELIGSVVLEAVKRALYLQTGLGYKQQHSIFARIRRFGITEESMLEKLGNEADKEKIRAFKKSMSKLACNNELVVLTSLYVHLLDQLKWGMITCDEAEYAADILLKKMKIEGKIEKLNCREGMLRVYKNGIFEKIISNGE